ncbi:MAG TPA: hypothetical protein VM936_03525 [Pyrinomonadaceae bacterium]|nr:hypothetical protein [Pyrinomonadaceae bacterium]
MAHRPARITKHFLTPALALAFALASAAPPASGAKGRRRPPASGGTAVVVDERLSVLRDAPSVSANLLQRLGRGRYVSVTGERRTREGLVFLRVAVTSRTSGWVQSDALVRPSRAGEDARLLRLIKGSEDFDGLARARIFLEAFSRSPLRPAVLLLFGVAAEEAAARLTREASRRLDAREMEAGGAPRSTYFLNYNGLDRYRRQGVVFTFDARAKQFRYDGAAFREILRRHPDSPEAAEARGRLERTIPAPE